MAAHLARLAKELWNSTAAARGSRGRFVLLGSALSGERTTNRKALEQRLPGLLRATRKGGGGGARLMLR